MNTAIGICLGFCDMGYDAAANEKFPQLLRANFAFWGAFWFWAAKLLQGEAVATWQEFREERAWSQA